MTPLGYDQPLYLLPFDHRHSYISGMFHFEPPLTQEQHAAAGILVDEEFGAAILHDARQRSFVTAVSTEKSGSDEFEFEYGTDFARHIEAVAPSFAKALVRYNPQGERALNQRQEERLKQLSVACHRSERRFMFELLVPATAAQLERVAGDTDAYYQRTRPQLMIDAMRALQDAGVEPDVWKIEGLARRADEAKVRSWLATAAGVTGFIGFAVGRTSFWDAAAGFHAQTLTRAQAAAQIAGRFRDWVDVFERARRAAAGAAP